jgi:hypothetical protein
MLLALIASIAASISAWDLSITLGNSLPLIWGIPYKKGGKYGGISDYNQYAIQNKLGGLSRE